MKKLLVAGIAAAAFAAAPAIAADLARKAPPVVATAPMFNWSGFYVGGQIGYNWGNYDFEVPGTGTASYDLNGVTGGAHAGYNWQAGSWVYGIEADWNAVNANGNDGGFGGTLDSSKLRDTGSIRGRLGVANNNWLFYTTGGWAFARVSHTRDAIGETVNKTLDGWTLGAGVSVALSPNWIAGLEYRYTNYGSKTFNWIASIPTISGLDTNEITFRLSYKFGDPWGKAPISAKY